MFLLFRIPWSSLQSQPVIISLENIKVLAKVSPEELVQRKTMTAAEVETQRVRAKREEIERVEAFYRAKQGDSDPDEEEDKEEETDTDVRKSQSFVAKLSKKILDNLQLVLKKIHVQVVAENTGTFGVAVKELSLTSVDEKWNRSFVVGQVDLRKVLLFEDLFLYFNDESKMNTSKAARKVDEVLFQKGFRDAHYHPLLQEEEILMKMLIKGAPADTLQKTNEAKYVSLYYHSFLTCYLPGFSFTCRSKTSICLLRSHSMTACLPWSGGYRKRIKVSLQLA